MHVLSVAVFLAAFATLMVYGEEDVFDAENCGLTYYNETIRRPSVARLREFPWLARLGYQWTPEMPVEYHFHATLIHRYYAVTTDFAAGYRSRVKFVRLGDYHTSDERDCQEVDDTEVCALAPQDIPVLYVVKHPDFNRPPRTTHDLVLIKFQKPAEFNEFVQPICLPPPSGSLAALSEDSLLFLSAWCGSVKTGISEVPRQYRLQQISVASCNEKLSSHMSIAVHESQFCAVLDLPKNSTKDASLRGSTGAPLQMLDRTGKRFQLVGMSSIGVRNAAPDVPSVFTAVLHLNDWLRSTVAREEEKRLGKL